MVAVLIACTACFGAWLCCLFCGVSLLRSTASTCIHTAPALIPLSIMTKGTGEVAQGVASSEGAKYEVTVMTAAVMLAGRVPHAVKSCA